MEIIFFFRFFLNNNGAASCSEQYIYIYFFDTSNDVVSVVLLKSTDIMKMGLFSLNAHCGERVRMKYHSFYSYFITIGSHGDHLFFRILKKNIYQAEKKVKNITKC